MTAEETGWQHRTGGLSPQPQRLGTPRLCGCSLNVPSLLRNISLQGTKSVLSCVWSAVRIMPHTGVFGNRALFTACSGLTSQPRIAGNLASSRTASTNLILPDRMNRILIAACTLFSSSDPPRPIAETVVRERSQERRFVSREGTSQAPRGDGEGSRPACRTRRLTAAIAFLL